jgi:hypothetical protein
MFTRLKNDNRSSQNPLHHASTALPQPPANTTIPCSGRDEAAKKPRAALSLEVLQVPKKCDA